MLASDVLALLEAGSGKEAAQPRCPSPAPLQASQRDHGLQGARSCSRRSHSWLAFPSAGWRRAQAWNWPFPRPAALVGSGRDARRSQAAGRPTAHPGSRALSRRRFTAVSLVPLASQERQKRPRLCHSHLVSAASPEEQLVECSSALPTPALPEQATAAASPQETSTDAAGDAAPASDTLPWQASYLMKYVQQCLEQLTSMYPQCAPIQTRTRAAQMAVALFRCAVPWAGRAPLLAAALGLPAARVSLSARSVARPAGRGPARRAGAAASTGATLALGHRMTGGWAPSLRLPPPSPHPNTPPPLPSLPYPGRRVYLRRSKDERAALLRELLMAQSLLAAALWIAVKFEANRSATPDSHIMSRITGEPLGYLAFD